MLFRSGRVVTPSGWTAEPIGVLGTYKEDGSEGGSELARDGMSREEEV